MTVAHRRFKEEVAIGPYDVDRQYARKERGPSGAKWKVQLITALALAANILGFGVANAWAHCDTESGPVAVDAREALASGHFEQVAIWIGPEEHEELLSAFELASAVYQMEGKAKELAERHFVETAVRLHRQAEGFPYTGLKPPQPLPPDVAAAERALATGDLQPVSTLLTSELQETLQSLFVKARAAQSNKDKSLTAGREWADAYVKYVVYVHGLHQTIQAGPRHGVGD